MSHQTLPGEEPTDIKQLVLDANIYDQPVHGFYRGIVVQNNDPERRGRVKIFIPAFSPQIFKQGWSNANEENKFTDKKFRFPQGSNLYKENGETLPWLGQVFEDAKNVLPWAEQASGLMGAGSSGLFGFQENKATISDSAGPDRFSPYDDARKPEGGEQNVDSIGEKPGYKFEPDDPSRDLYDGFVSFNQDKMPDVNPYAKIYKPSTYSNAAKGMFSIPNVGAVVWVFFEGGSITKPVYFAYSFDKQDWQTVYDIITTEEESNGPHYPGAFENTDATTTPIKKGKTVFNSKAGALEFVDTDDHEQVKLTHSSGSFIQMSNNATVEYVSSNEQKLISANQFETVNQTKNVHVRKNYNIGVDESRWTRVGAWNVDAYNGWIQQNLIIADTRARFPIQRTNAQPAYSKTSLPAGSTKQKQRGEYGPNAVLDEQTPIVISPEIVSVYNEIPVSSALKGNQPSTLETATNPVKANNSRKSNLNLSPERFAAAAGSAGSNNYIGDGTLSNSTEGGKWQPDDDYANIAKLEEDQLQKMVEFETQFGTGGDDLLEITRHRVTIIGAATNTSPSVRVDPVGKTGFNEVLISSSGAFASQKPSPLIERVANDGKFPCGNETIVVGNKFTITTGTGGMQLMSSGCTDICGTQVVIAAANEAIISSTGDVKISSGGRFDVTADIITFRQAEGKQVGIDCSLGVKNNLIIAGSAYIEGELFINHITCPVEVQETEQTIVYGKTRDEPEAYVIGYVRINDGWSAVYSACMDGGQLRTSTPDCIVTVPHSHNFKNIPLTLKKSNESLRSAASTLNKGVIQVGAAPVQNGMKSIS